VLFLSPKTQGTSQMKIAEIKELTTKELEARKREIKQETFNLRIQQQAGQLEKPHMLRALRRDAARIETVLSTKLKDQSAK
jgi:large subunit ribosomal protein L29